MIFWILPNLLCDKVIWLRALTLNQLPQLSFRDYEVFKFVCPHFMGEHLDLPLSVWVSVHLKILWQRWKSGVILNTGLVLYMCKTRSLYQKYFVVQHFILIVYNNVYAVFVKRWIISQMNIYVTHFYTSWFPFWKFRKV